MRAPPLPFNLALQYVESVEIANTMGTNSLLLCVFVLVASSSAFTVLSLGDDGTASVLPCLSELMPCTPYLHAEKPPAVCCMPLKIALDTEAPCLCKLFDDQALLGTFNVTQSDMLHFPQKCGHAPPDLSLCKNSAGTFNDKSRHALF